ncbi:hypothetical protein EOA75_12085 [Mesorhizobium sp. M1A.F.Ca.IN.022.07.1.1]|uniref:hypothetical protein n=1 Tax=Mesorhizobium sp. M1A.F.Ca.IN.022.07.1.1 TaxID=2496767 RepID=UPI000FCC605F|nr:hypothetical protein [Mesorhizobium sp. M1A.F.Ca.IN.022.07.1.1]RUV94262.1 hypothetical protein EOA75_12085 [Mesorhizobium sp. M1A.F.Ca.IN.022.07.1.1]TIS61347.1 MAG: hypothetical protein E5X11_11170 [Mesorhizobium sp.]
MAVRLKSQSKDASVQRAGVYAPERPDADREGLVFFWKSGIFNQRSVCRRGSGASIPGAAKNLLEAASAGAAQATPALPRRPYKMDSMSSPRRCVRENTTFDVVSSSKASFPREAPASFATRNENCFGQRKFFTNRISWMMPTMRRSHGSKRQANHFPALYKNSPLFLFDFKT